MVKEVQTHVPQKVKGQRDGGKRAVPKWKYGSVQSKTPPFSRC